MSTTDSTHAPVEQEHVQAGLLDGIRDALDCCDRIREAINDGGVTNWVQGRGEGHALAQTNAARDALISLQATLTISLGWKRYPDGPEERSPLSYGFVLPADDPPVTPQEDAAFTRDEQGWD